ncbi:MAG: hypothetical protein Q8M74_00460 [Chloroflexota bacterium]|nr:hypothetical protein [Chloroflexota bacterium]
MADKIKPSTPVRATTHPGDTRSNIPTAELESFARPDEKRPAIVCYQRNPDLDPQLADLEVPAVPSAERQGRQAAVSLWIQSWNDTSRLTVSAPVSNVTVLIFPAVHHVVDWRGYLFPVIR